LVVDIPEGTPCPAARLGALTCAAPDGPCAVVEARRAAATGFLLLRLAPEVVFFVF